MANVTMRARSNLCMHKGIPKKFQSVPAKCHVLLMCGLPAVIHEFSWTEQRKSCVDEKKKKKKNYVGSEALPTSIKERKTPRA